MSKTASDVLSEFEVIIIDTAKIKSLFSAENEASAQQNFGFTRHASRL